LLATTPGRGAPNVPVEEGQHAASRGTRHLTFGVPKGIPLWDRLEGRLAGGQSVTLLWAPACRAAARARDKLTR
jgi:hypothetical protein